ncbi:hypothetical protein CEXT_553081 [Caerostris extrusa]|uniref:Uncharacterized protein n=1 Tax=Caerostris extrusa TaxID=172846 RepID=A0AAV4XFS7_CAEEX|nr:hypothetical protein CEXT_553081 [Caerostris extrusa]
MVESNSIRDLVPGSNHLLTSFDYFFPRPVSQGHRRTILLKQQIVLLSQSILMLNGPILAWTTLFGLCYLLEGVSSLFRLLISNFVFEAGLVLMKEWKPAEKINK